MNSVLLDSKSMAVNISTIIHKARVTFDSGVTRSMAWRRKQLLNLQRMYKENYDAMIEVLHKDLGRSKTEAVVYEVQYLINDLENTLRHLKDWMKPEHLPKEYLYVIFDDVVVYKNPYGVVLVIGAWNFPLMLVLLPLAGAIAAGNVVIIKPSEIAEATAKFVAETLPKYLDNDAVFIVEGGAEETTVLLNNKFDYIFYTGSAEIGKIVYTAAAKHLTPVTMELGGKSPLYIDDTVDIEISAKRILWGKLINNGQSCVAPDYIICTKELQDKFIAVSKKIFLDWYTHEPKNSPDLGRIINEKHFNRLVDLIAESKDKIVIGGDYVKQDRFISPTILANVVASDKIMQDEIFGPILPIFPVDNVYEAIALINSKESPLAIYVFSKDDKTHKLFLEQTRSGGVYFNDTFLYCNVDNLPFGGVGGSGIGFYHGKFTFDTFSSKKSCLKRSMFFLLELIESIRYPPYSNGAKLSLLTTLAKKTRVPPIKFLLHILVFLLGFGLTYKFLI